MRLGRRGFITAMGALAAAGSAPRALAEIQSSADPRFPIPEGQVYLSAARIHPLSQASLDFIQKYLGYRSSTLAVFSQFLDDLEKEIKASFATLINATPEEIAYVQSTQIGENLVVAGLGLAGKGKNIVTDELHYRGSIYFYGELAKHGIAEIRTVKLRDNRIHLDDMKAKIDGNTALVSLSLVSYMNGFLHDLKAVCEIAHAKGALVYADIVQAAGAVPIDVQDSQVDCAACSAYKWLMGEKGLGFLYVRKGLLDTVIKRTQFGEDQLAHYRDHLFLFDPPVGAPPTWQARTDTGGHFEVGSYAAVVLASLQPSLRFLNLKGVGRIQEARRPLMKKIKEEITGLGFRCVTPTIDTPIMSFAVPDRDAIAVKLANARISVSFIEHVLRISPSVYNTEDDIGQLVQALRA